MGYIEIKGKTKSFVEKHKNELILIGGVAGCLLLGKAVGTTIYRCGLYRGHLEGAAIGFNTTIDWFDEKYPEKQLRETWIKYMEEHPEKIVKMKFKV